MSNNNEKKTAEKCKCCGRSIMTIGVLFALGFGLVSIMAVMSLKNYIMSKHYATREYVQQYVDNAVGSSTSEKKQEESDKKALNCDNIETEEDQERCDWASKNSYGFEEE